MALTRVGRYVLFGQIASGGMATVYYGRQVGSAGFARIVAIKRLHPHLAKDAEFASMFLDESRIAARVRHANVVSAIDVVSLPEGELLLVMEYVLGEPLSRLLRRLREGGEPLPYEIAAGIMCDTLHGLHAAHEARSELGEPLGIIHRDVSPHNIMVGGDGISRVIDFGVAKARGRVHATRDGQIKGKLSYMAPEQLRGKNVDRRCDVFSSGVVFWEALTGQRLFGADSEGETVTRVLEAPLIPPSQIVTTLPHALDAIVLKALARDPSKRFDSARDMATAIEAAIGIANTRAVSVWIHGVAGELLAARAQTIAELERNEATENSTAVRDEPAQSQVSSVSVSVDTRPRRRDIVAKVVVPLVALLMLAAVAARYVTSRHTEVRVASQPTATELASTLPQAASAQVVTTTVDRVVEVPNALPTARRTRSVAQAITPITPIAPSVTAAPVASEHCPIKTYTGDDGIVRFRRDCSP